MMSDGGAWRKGWGTLGNRSSGRGEYGRKWKCREREVDCGGQWNMGSREEICG